MAGIHDTAYPRLKSQFSRQELSEIFTPTAAEVELAHSVAKSTSLRIAFLVMVKSFGRLGYFPQLHKVPRQLAEYISRFYGVHYDAIEWEAYDASGSRYCHIDAIRSHFGIKTLDADAQQILSSTMRQAALLRHDLADLINIGIEELIRQHYELPGFRALADEAQRVRGSVNRGIYDRIYTDLGEKRRQSIDKLLEVEAEAKRSLWNQLKVDVGAPTLTHVRSWIDRLRWLKSFSLDTVQLLDDISAAKIRNFAVQARSLNAARMLEMEPHKRYTLVLTLIRQQTSHCLDDLGDLLVKKVRRSHNQAQAEHEKLLLSQQGLTHNLVRTLHQMLLVMSDSQSAVGKLESLEILIGNRLDHLLEQCEEFESMADRNYLPFLRRYFRSYRAALFSIIEVVELIAPGSDKTIEQCIAFIKQQRKNRQQWMNLKSGRTQFDLSWIPDRWWNLVTGCSNRTTAVGRINLRYVELYVFTQIAGDLQSGDLVIPGSEKYSDYREQFLTDEEFRAGAEGYCEQAGLPKDANAFVEQCRQRLAKSAFAADASFPQNEYLRIKNGEPVLARLKRSATPENLEFIAQGVREHLSPLSLLDVLSDTEKWLNWTRYFGPLSGHGSKVDDPVSRYLTTVFAYGCNLGPGQASQAISELDRFQLAWINQRHISEANLDEAITELVNGYNRFLLPSLWGTGESASADGTKWDVYEQNLLSEYHIRYGGYGGIGYYHISDKYIALFSHFIPCGVREAVYILDGLFRNNSDIRPDVMHSDTHGQTEPVFGLAHMLGIKLMPRIRNWKDLKFYRPTKKTRYQHLDLLFNTEVDWQLIRDHFEEMLKVAVSISQGRLLPSTILRRFGSNSPHNRLYLAFRELGRAVRTEFLLKYITDIELRKMILGAMNKSEDFNRFVQWIAFGGQGVIAENNRDEQRKLIKYNHLVANCLIFHNV